MHCGVGAPDFGIQTCVSETNRGFEYPVERLLPHLQHDTRERCEEENESWRGRFVDYAAEN